MQSGWQIVSGGALGIDTTAHMATLHAGGITAAVLASGLDCLYPSQNIDLFQDIVRRGGILVSEFPPGVRPEKGYFPRRNRLISALSSGVVVMQCGAKSGALHTASCAKQIQVPVLTFAGKSQDPLAAGSYFLAREGAWVVESGFEISQRLRVHQTDSPQMSLWEFKTEEQTSTSLQETVQPVIPTRSQTAQALATPAEDTPDPVFVSQVVETRLRMQREGEQHDQRELPNMETWPVLWKNIWDILPDEECEPLHLDHVVAEVAVPVEEVSAALVLLELEGVVWSTQDTRYSRRR